MSTHLIATADSEGESDGYRPAPPTPPQLKQRSLRRFGYFKGGGGGEVASSEKGMSSEVEYGPNLLNICGSNPEQ